MSVTIHTTIGDIKVEIFCDTAPRTAFNFLALAASGAYDGTTFHRNIRGFMIQAGDTADKTGTKGGESIWGAVSFPDEFHPSNLHDKRGMLSMANKGTDAKSGISYAHVCDIEGLGLAHIIVFTFPCRPKYESISILYLL
jgi:cyclophilin family peptidyl-prolyl cis-trans isomerase